MTYGLVVAIAAVQGLFVIALIVYLVVGYRRDRAGDRRLDRDRSRLDTLLRDFQEGTLPRAEVVRGLDSLHPESLTMFLCRSSASPGGLYLERVVEVLRETRWMARVRRDARSRLWWRRLRSARVLSAVAAPEDLLLVHDLLSDEVPAIQLAAVHTLHRLPSPGLAGAILDRASINETIVRNHLLENLASSGTVVLPALIDRLGRPAEPTRLRALIDLAGMIAIPALLPYIVRHADAESFEVRLAVATALRTYPHPQSAQTLMRLIDDPAWQVRARAAASLGAMGAVESLEPLGRALCDLNWWVRLRSAIALRLLGPRGRTLLEAFDESMDRFARDMAHYVLELDDAAMAEYVGGSAADFTPVQIRAEAI